MIGEHEFVVDLVLASLVPRLEATEESIIVTNIHGRVKLNLIGNELRRKQKGWTTYLLRTPVYSGALRCLTDSLQNRRLSCVCSSYNKDSELDVWNVTRGLFCAWLDAWL